MSVNRHGVFCRKSKDVFAVFVLFDVARHHVLNKLVVLYFNVHVHAVLDFFVFRIRVETYLVTQYLRRFVVDRKGKVEGVAVGVLSAFVIQRTFKRHFVGRIFLQIPIQCVDVQYDCRAAVTAARRIGFADFFLNFAVNDLSRGSVGYDDFHCVCAAQQSCVHHVQLVYRVIVGLVKYRDCGFFLFGINLDVSGLLFVQIRTESKNVLVFEVSSQHSRCSRACHKFIFGGNAGILFTGGNFICAVVKQRSVCPVAVECEIGQTDCHFTSVDRCQRNETFDVHTVGKTIFDVSFVCIGQRDFYADFKALVCADFHTADFFATDKHLGVCRQHVRFFRNGLVVRSKRFRHYVDVGVVRYCFCCDVVYRKCKFVHARAIGVIVQFHFGLVAHIAVAVGNGNVTFRRGCVFDTCKPCTLLTGRVRITLLVQSDGCRTHQHLIDKRGQLHSCRSRVCLKFRISGFEILTKQCDCTCHVGCSHTCSAVPACNGTCDFAAVCGNFGFQLQVGHRSPAGEIRHEGTCLEFRTDFDVTDASLCRVNDTFACVHRNRHRRYGIGHFT